MSVLVSNGHLRPDANGGVTKAETHAALLRIGISRETADATAGDNFKHLKSHEKLNLFNMQGNLNVEHHRCRVFLFPPAPYVLCAAL